MKNIIQFTKKIVLSFAVLYSYNLIAVNFNMIIPINFFTIILVTLLGTPSLLALILFKIIIL